MIDVSYVLFRFGCVGTFRTFLEQRLLIRFYAQTLILVNLIVVKIIPFLGHNSEPCRNFGTILRHKLPIIHPDLPIPTRDLNSSVQSEFLKPKFLYENPKLSDIFLLNQEFPISPFWGPIKPAEVRVLAGSGRSGRLVAYILLQYYAITPS